MRVYERPFTEPQINSAYRASATKGVLRPKIANSERQSLLILKVTTSITFCAGATGLVYRRSCHGKKFFKSVDAARLGSKQ